jgi:hypothetical protein
MPSVPDQPSPHHDQPSLAELRRRYGAAWEITEHSELPVLTATHRSGDRRHIRCIVAHSPAELAAKLAVAGTVEP